MRSSLIVTSSPTDSRARRSRSALGWVRVLSLAMLPGLLPAIDSQAAVDIEAQQALLRTAPGGGDEVTTPAMGQTVYFHVGFRLTGPTGALAVTRRALLDGVEFCAFTSEITSGDWFSWCLDGWTATAGTHTLRWDLDYTNAVAETNESNNSAAKTWTTGGPTPTPGNGVDIQAQRAFMRTAAGSGDEVATPAVGQTIYFHVDFHLTGAAGSVTMSGRARLDGVDFCTFTSDITSGNWTAWCAQGWTATAGTHTLQWDLDYTNAVAETNENNNSAATTWTSAGPTPTPANGVDIEAQRAFLRTAAGGGDEVATPAVGQTVYLHVGFRLTSPAGSVAVSRRARLDGVEFCAFTSEITPDDWFSWCLDGWTATAGTHTLQWDLDYTNAVAETNESNNSAATTWTSGGPSCAGDCDHSGEVAVSELVTMVNVALGSAALSACPVGDADGSGTIEVNEIIAAVNNALNGCP